MKKLNWHKATQKAVAFTLRMTFEMSYAKIADIVETSPSSVKRWFSSEDGTATTTQAERVGKFKKDPKNGNTKRILSSLEKHELFVGQPLEERGKYFIGGITAERAIVVEFMNNGDAVLCVVNEDKSTTFKIAKKLLENKPKSDFVAVETPNSITIVEKGKPRTISKNNPAFKVAQRMLRKGRIEDAHSSMTNVDSKAYMVFTEGRVSIDEKGNVFFDDENIESKLASKIYASFVAGNDVCRSLSMFLERIKSNPDPAITAKIYDFISANDIEIDSEGFIIAFKVVRADYKDKHSRTMDNTPGGIVEMDRKNVNNNPSQTCSYGLHLCSLSYVPHFGNTQNGDRLLKCLVDPADFVSIPIDYNNAKARVCEYFVLEDVTDAYNKGELKKPV